MNKNIITEKIAPAVAGRGCFITEVTVSTANDVTIYIEKTDGIVDWDDCAAIDEAFHAIFDQDEEDYSLTVSSAGLDRPFKVYAQYVKAIGTDVDVRFKGGKRLVARLVGATEDSVTLAFESMETVEGTKKKQRVAREETFALKEINSVTPSLDFK